MPYVSSIMKHDWTSVSGGHRTSVSGILKIKLTRTPVFSEPTYTHVGRKNALRVVGHPWMKHPIKYNKDEMYKL